MPKERIKRADVRLQRKQKRKREEEENQKANLKRQRPSLAQDDECGVEAAGEADVAELAKLQAHGMGEKEFFGMLTDEEQEYFRRADEILELNDFGTAEDRAVFVESVFHEARDKELKLASSQSCSRLMERLIQVSTTGQKKRLFEAFGGHFLSLVQHRFASHCCEALFVHSAGVVTQELAGFVGFVVDTRRPSEQQQQEEPEASMESLFLATLDELEGSLSFLAVDRAASHALRVLLLVLSGQPLQGDVMRRVVRSSKKEQVWVDGLHAAATLSEGVRAVPASFTAAVCKIIADTTHGLGPSGLRMLVKHPVGNPTLQLLLELDMTLARAEGKPAAECKPAAESLLLLLLPNAPESLADAESEACAFVNGAMYDQIGSRLMETLVTHCPGKVFKALNQHLLLPRIAGYARNDIAVYPAIKVLMRLGRDDLAAAVAQIAPTVPQLIAKGRYNVLTTLIERCVVRRLDQEIKTLVRAIKQGCGSEPVDLITTLCGLDDDDDDANANANAKKTAKPSGVQQQLQRNKAALQSHGAQLLCSLLSVPGPAKGVHEALTALPTPLLLRLAHASPRTASLLTTALSTPSPNAAFQKTLVNTIMPHAADLAASQHAYMLVAAVFQLPARDRDLCIPLHVKENVMLCLAAQEALLRDSWGGRSVWRACKGDWYKTRRADWKAWAKLPDAAASAAPALPRVARANKASG